MSRIPSNTLFSAGTNTPSYYPEGGWQNWFWHVEYEEIRDYANRSSKFKFKLCIDRIPGSDHYMNNPTVNFQYFIRDTAGATYSDSTTFKPGRYLSTVGAPQISLFDGTNYVYFGVLEIGTVETGSISWSNSYIANSTLNLGFRFTCDVSPSYSSRDGGWFSSTETLDSINIQDPTVYNASVDNLKPYIYGGSQIAYDGTLKYSVSDFTSTNIVFADIYSPDSPDGYPDEPFKGYRGRYALIWNASQMGTNFNSSIALSDILKQKFSNTDMISIVGDGWDDKYWIKYFAPNTQYDIWIHARRNSEKEIYGKKYVYLKINGEGAYIRVNNKWVYSKPKIKINNSFTDVSTKIQINGSFKITS